MITTRGRRRQPTKQRLIEAGVRLFAEKGFRETTVGEVEAAAGLEPRRGALYRHFPSKEALLEAALEQHLEGLPQAEAGVDEGVDEGVDQGVDQPTDTTREEALAIGRWLLAELDREQPIVRILEQDGERLPDLRDRFRQSLVEPGYVVAADLARRWLGKRAAAVDVEALSAVLLGALINYRRSMWTFGDAPAGVEEERFLASWADLCSASATASRRQPR
jgi:AcrR family transcriptional regulator